MDSSTSLDRSISNRKSTWEVLLLACFTNISVFYANSVGLDQTPRSMASVSGTTLFDNIPYIPRHKWVKRILLENALELKDQIKPHISTV